MDRSEIYKLEFTDLTSVQIEICTAFLNNFGIAAIEEHQSGIILYEEDKELLNAARQMIVENIDGIIKENSTLVQIEDRNWNAEWEASFAPIVIDDFCTIKASHHDGDFATQHIITINPELAFGTGHHETTYQMISIMRELDLEGRKVLDYGCGTGVLAILAERLGARPIDAIDNDIRAVECAKECIGLNKANHVNLLRSTLEEMSATSYDVILANINRNVLLQSSELLRNKLKKNGILLLSGILTEDQDLILEKYSNYHLIKRSKKGNWVCVLLQLT